MKSINKVHLYISDSSSVEDKSKPEESKMFESLKCPTCSCFTSTLTIMDKKRHYCPRCCVTFSRSEDRKIKNQSTNDIYGANNENSTLDDVNFNVNKVHDADDIKKEISFPNDDYDKSIDNNENVDDTISDKSKDLAQVNGSKDQLVMCDQCQQIFISKNSMLAHISLVHKKDKSISKPEDEIKDFKSPQTGNGSARKEKMSDHKCEFCQKSFKLKIGLKKHTKLVHGSNESSLVTNEIKSKSSVSNNIDEKNYELPFMCDMCKQCFKSVKELGTHISIVHEDKAISESELDEV